MAKIKKNKLFPVIGMGGSAGSFQAFETFFKHMPPDSGMAFVIIMHLDPNHKGSIPHLIQNYTTMVVVEAADGMAIEANRVYIIPPNADMGIHNRKLLLLKPAKMRGHSMPIDYFLQSLAEDLWNKAVGIIFSGMGSDGETGIRMIKEKLGMTMAQDPETAAYASMPNSAIETNLVDYVVAPEEMPGKLLQYLNHPVIADDTNDEAINEIKNTNAVQKIMMLLRSHTGHDFSLYKKSTITRRIDRRIAYYQLSNYAEYVNYLRENPHEIDILFQELLIGVTKFFRDPQAYEALQKRLFPLLSKKPDNEPIRVWVAGCSTGEEAYSVAIIIMEYLKTLQGAHVPKVQIFATDLDSQAIEHARTGLYRGNIVADVSPERLNNYFVKADDWFTIKKELREMIVFAQHNIVKDAPFTKLDLLCCRNVMIYLTAELQQKILPLFHYSLNPHGLYFMGPAETLGGFSDMFMPVDSKWKIFERKEGASFFGKMIDFPFHTSKHLTPVIKPDVGIQTRKKSLGEVFNQVLIDNYTPAAVLVNEKGDIMYSNGKAGKYLQLPAGEAVMNIYQMAREELKYALNNAVNQAIMQKTTVMVNDIKLKEEPDVRMLNLRISYLDNTPLQGLVLVLFEDKGLAKKKRQPAKTKLSERDAIVEEMEKELIYTKQQLHTTIEQMETSLEELKSTNEELQSTNEEMQSTNEEALTTKEEMQSLNEELMTINMQYEHKAEQLTQLNNDMKNMLDNTEIGTIFLDNNLNILRFTPQIKKLFNVIPTDVGRSITHIVSNSDYPSIESDIREVIERLVIKEVEIKTKLQDWYNLRIMPYRTMDNFISGAVLTINRITPYKHLENSLHVILKYMHQHINVIDDGAMILDRNLRIVQANSTLQNMPWFKGENLQGLLLDKVLPVKWKTPQLNNLVQQCTKTTVSAEVEYKDDAGKPEKVTITASPYTDKESGETFVNLIVIQDK
jgi:two-component system, chemotaxis family, CheB/CheR fusion protein